MTPTYTCILLVALVVTANCLSMHYPSLQSQNFEQETNQTLNASALAQTQIQRTQPKHNPVQVIGLILKGVKELVGIAKKNFMASCKDLSTKKINWINIENLMNVQLTFAGVYLANGDFFQNGEPYLRNKNVVRWVFGQKILLGSKGMIVYRIKDGSNNSLVVYFNIPSTPKPWNSYGVCITSFNYPKDGQSSLSQEILQKKFITIGNNINKPIKNCILIDNTKTKKMSVLENFNKTIEYQKRRYYIELLGLYEKESTATLSSCYRQLVFTVIKEA